MADIEIDITSAQQEQPDIDVHPIYGVQGEQGPQGIQGPKGDTGATGQDGFSPIATVTKSGTTATITITDKNGTTTASVSDGTGTVNSVNNTLPDANGNVTISNFANKDLSNLSLSGFEVLNEQQTLQRAYSISYGDLTSEFNFYTSIYKITIASNTTFVFPDNLVLPVRDVNFGSVTFELYIDMSSTVYSLTFPSSVSWQDGQTPDLSTTGKYFLVFRTFDNGTTWFGNLQGKW